jgi:hypothetical protein
MEGEGGPGGALTRHKRQKQVRTLELRFNFEISLLLSTLLPNSRHFCKISLLFITREPLSMPVKSFCLIILTPEVKQRLFIALSLISILLCNPRSISPTTLQSNTN